MPPSRHQVSRIPALERLGRCAFALLCAALFAGHVDAQQTDSRAWVRGIVRDELTRAPIASALVELLGAEGETISSTATNLEGLFELIAPSPGEYRLRASRLGYSQGAGTLNVIGAADTVTIELRLSPSPVLLDSILVTGRADTRPLRPMEQLIHGRLLDDDSRAPIADGTIHLHGADGKRVSSTITNAQGLFRIVTPRPGTYTVRAERIGYAAAESPKLPVMPRDTIRLDFFLSVNAVLLDPILVTGSARPWVNRYALVGMEDLWRRMENWSRRGYYLLRDTLEWGDRRGFTTSWLIREFASRRPSGCNGGTSYWINGAPTEMPPGMSLDDLYPPATLEAVEVYVAQPIPADLVNPTGGRFPCRVIVLWSRRGPKL